ncbi:amidase [Sphaerisporangium aureirubrum]|uniref:Amidase n=1 Tax=Sphaerisporangium aureirubrum TaxID=1544736 RepID=A0ABW1NMN7_9ACTN
MAELWEMGARELAGMVGERRVSCREVVEAHLGRIEEVGGQVNAVTVVLGDAALGAADETDRALRRGEAAGALAGVPMTVKENIDVAGSATTFGIEALRDAVAVRDAPHIAQLRAAGAIPIGRGNMPEFGMRWHTDNALRGATRNPWSAGHTPGGSSGGDAVAVATGMAALGMGNDGAGSLRWPARCCGVAALKPSLGRVAQAGPGSRRPMPFAFQLLGVHGVIARRVEDLRLAFAHMCGGPGDADPWYAPVPLRGPGPAAPLRVAVIGSGPGDGDESGAVRRAAGLLAGAGYLVEERTPPALVRAAELHTQIMSAYGRVHEEQPPVETVASEGFVRFWAAFEETWNRAAGERAFDPMMERAALVAAWAEWMTHTPLLLAPVCALPPFRVGTDLDPGWLSGWPAALRATVAVNLLGLPAVTVPTGTSGGLPQAVQIIAPRFREDLCLDAASAVETGTPSLTPLTPLLASRDHAGDGRPPGTR